MNETSSIGEEGRVAHEDLIDVLAQSAFAVTAVLSRVAAENDLSLTQLRVLAILRGRRLRMSELADYLGLERSTLSGLIDRAEARGLLERVPDRQDGRAIDVLLTDRGRRLAPRVFAQVSAGLRPMVDVLGVAEQQSLQKLLTAMLGAHLS
jgi:DNA-binding MarR family transcriptional regulator